MLEISILLDRSQPKSLFHRLKTCALNSGVFRVSQHVPPGMFTCEFVKGKEMEKIGPRLAIYLTDQANVN